MNYLLLIKYSVCYFIVAAVVVASSRGRDGSDSIKIKYKKIKDHERCKQTIKKNNLKKNLKDKYTCEEVTNFP